MGIHKIQVEALVDLNGVKAGEKFEMLPGALPYFADKVKVLNGKDKETKTKQTKEAKNTKTK